MSSDETPKIEPTLTVTDAPSIAPETKPEAAKSEIESPKVEAVEPPKLELTAEAKTEPKTEPEKIAPKLEPKLEVPTLPAAAQIEPPKFIMATHRPEPKVAKPAAPQPRSARFALLAASVAIAASFGAIGGSLGVAKFGPMIAPSQPEVVSVPKEHTADEIKALKDSIAQLRFFTKSLSENVAALKTTVNTTTAAANQQNGKIAEMLDRIEKAQAEQRKTAAAASAPTTSTTQAATAPEITGSIASQKQAAAVPMVLGDPPTTLKPPILHDYVVRRVYDGAALLEGRNGIIEVEIGATAPGLGRIESIKRQDGRWVVVTARGLVMGR
jgi:hypothetical protein